MTDCYVTPQHALAWGAPDNSHKTIVVVEGNPSPGHFVGAAPPVGGWVGRGLGSVGLGDSCLWDYPEVEEERQRIRRGDSKEGMVQNNGERGIKRETGDQGWKDNWRNQFVGNENQKQQPTERYMK